MDTPIGAEWNTRVGFQRGTLPKVTMKVSADVVIRVNFVDFHVGISLGQSLHHWRSLHDAACILYIYLSHELPIATSQEACASSSRCRLSTIFKITVRLLRREDPAIQFPRCPRCIRLTFFLASSRTYNASGWFAWGSFQDCRNASADVNAQVKFPCARLMSSIPVKPSGSRGSSRGHVTRTRDDCPEDNERRHHRHHAARRC